MVGVAPAGAGWFRDPTDARRWRWWDGTQWTTEVRDEPPEPAPEIVRGGTRYRVTSSLGVAAFVLGFALLWLAGESRDSYFTDGCAGWWSWYPALMLAAAGAWLISGVLVLLVASRAPRRAHRVVLTTLGVVALGLAGLFGMGMAGVLIAVADFSVGC